MRLLIILPIVIPLATAVVCLLLRGSTAMQRTVSLTGAAALLLTAAGLLAAVWERDAIVLQAGSWPAPYGITLVADLFSAVMVLLAALTFFAVTVYARASVTPGRERFGFHPLLHFLMMGLCGAFLTGDLFNLYVWFEVMLMSSFVLLALGGERPQLEGGIKYVTLNLLSSAVFLAAAGILYGTAGTLNMADAALRLRSLQDSGLPTVLGVMFLVAFGIKAAAFPFFFWLPASYHTPPVPIAALFAGLLTKVGVYAMIRVFTLIFTGATAFTHTLILWIAGFTMVTGVLGAMSQNDVRRILSFHIVSQIGYMIMGLGIFTPLALAGSVFYIIHHIIVKTNLFLISGLINRTGGSFCLQKVGGLYARVPVLAFLFLVSALSLAGIPPLSGFWAKLTLLRAGIEAQQWEVAAVSLAVSLLTLYSMSKIWSEAFWAPPADTPAPAPLDRTEWWTLFGPVMLLLLVTAAIGFGAEPVFRLAARTAEQLMTPDLYIRTVLGAAAQP
jgi:multicomponent Na+:H+ antiporter subunit D